MIRLRPNATASPVKVGLWYGAGCPLSGCCAYPGAGLRFIKRAADGWPIPFNFTIQL